MTPQSLRRRVALLDTLTGLLHELPEPERNAATTLVAWAARSIAAAKLDEPDDVYRRALDLVVREQRCSTSRLQRRLAIGYNVAARVVEELEARRVVGPAHGSRDREVIVGPGAQATRRPRKS